MLMDRKDIYQKEYELFVKAYEEAGEDSEPLVSQDYATMVINGDKVLASRGTEGIEMRAEMKGDGVVEAWITVKPGVKVEKPVHICLGMLPKEGKQHIINHIDVGEGAEVSLVSHCFFPNAVNVEHISEGFVNVGKDARFRYEEEHFHSETGGVLVRPVTHVKVLENGEYASIFTMKHGRMGEMYMDYEADVERNGKVSMITKVYGRGNDVVNGREVIRLNGDGASGIIKTRVALKDDATSEVINITEGNAPYCRGHVDCTEILMDNARATSIPQITATHPRAKVTHEAAIGSVDRKQLQTLMARGLTEDEATDMIVNGLLA